MEVKSAGDTKLELAFGYNRWESCKDQGPTGQYKVTKVIKGSPEWQTIPVSIEDLKPSSERLPASLTNNWQWLCDMALTAKVDGIRKIYWGSGNSIPVRAEPQAPAPSPVKVGESSKSKGDDMPELAGKSEEFKETVRNSLAEEKSK